MNFSMYGNNFNTYVLKFLEALFSSFSDVKKIPIHTYNMDFNFFKGFSHIAWRGT